MGFTHIRHFTDDGYTGTNFNRPGFQAMLEEVDAGNIATVIVKDMSRFGRNYLLVGNYTELLFPNKGVRFIAVNNGVDSANPTSSDFTPFLNIMNEWYAKDTSNKIKTVFRNRMKAGNRVSGSIPYGYYRKPDDKQTLYVDEEAAAVVRRIFDMAAHGAGLTEISDALTRDKVLIPSAYSQKYQPQNNRRTSYHDPYCWNNTTVSYILDRQEYLGHTILGKTISENFKIKKRRKASEDELIIFRNTHEPIITQEVWDAAQKLRKRSPRKLQNGTYSHRLSGLIFCADCGHRMSYKSPDAVRRPDNRHFDSDSGFQCVRYRNRYDGCISHSIKASVLEEAILKSIQAVSDYVLEDEDAFIEELQAQWQSQKQGLSAENKKDLANTKKRMDELDNLIRGLYESNLSGKLPDRQFQRLMAQYDEEQEQCENRIKELEAKAGDSTTSKVDPKRFVALVRKYQDCEVLTDDMYERDSIANDTSTKQSNADEYRVKMQYSAFSLAGEVARYLNISSILAAKILREAQDGMDVILADVNQYNAVLDDIIIPTIFHALFDVTAIQKTEDRDVVLLREPKDAAYYEFSAKDDLVITNKYPGFTPDEVLKSFHADTYCFDSLPEKECFFQYIKSDKVQEVYFTGMFTSNQGDLSVYYYDPESSRIRQYYPDFLAKMKDGTYQLIEVKGDNKIDDVVVQAKKEAALEMAVASGIKYEMYAGSTIMKTHILESLPVQQTNLLP